MKLKENENVVKGISRKNFKIISLESCPTVHLGGRPMTGSEKYPAIRLGGFFNILPKLGSVFSRTIAFAMKTDYFTRIRLRHI